jgi:hypothetical protein
MDTLELFEKVNSKELSPQEANKQLLVLFTIIPNLCKYCGSYNLDYKDGYKYCIDCDMELN